MPPSITIPHGVTFEDLKIYRDADGAISIDAQIAAIALRANGFPVDAPEAPQLACGIIVAWYWQHRAAGGRANDISEDFIGAWGRSDRQFLVVTHSGELARKNADAFE
jgi:hypothetical protein